jgi:putative tryptophan/tyrosine transport system substrate-binding protein
MRRREFIAGLGSAATWPMVTRAQQQPALPVIGFLSVQTAEVDYKIITVPFLQGLKEAGYVEGQNVAVEYRYAENQLANRPYEPCCRRNEDEAARVGRGGEKSAGADQSIANASTKSRENKMRTMMVSFGGQQRCQRKCRR